MKPDTKVVLLGQENIGKTCLIHRIITGTYRSEYENTIGAAFCSKRVNVKNQSVTLGIWDTAGAEKFESMSRQYTRNSDAAIICYDVTDRHSFERAKRWVIKIKSDEPKCRIYFTGTKIDLQDHVITEQMASEYVYMEGIKSFRTSSLENINISQLFYAIAADHQESADVTRANSTRSRLLTPTIDITDSTQSSQRCIKCRFS